MQQAATVGVAASDDLLTIPQVGQVLQVNRSTVYRYIANDALPSVHIGAGKARRIRRSDLDAWIAARVSVAVAAS